MGCCVSLVRDIEILFLSKVAILTSMGRTLDHADLLNLLSVRDENPFPRPRQLPPWPRSSAILDEHALSSRCHVWVIYPVQICMNSQEEPRLCVFFEPLYNFGSWNGQSFRSIYKKTEEEAKKRPLLVSIDDSAKSALSISAGSRMVLWVIYDFDVFVDAIRTYLYSVKRFGCEQLRAALDKRS